MFYVNNIGKATAIVNTKLRMQDNQISWLNVIYSQTKT